MIRARALALLCALAPMMVAPHVTAQTYPVRPVRMVVPFPPGGGTDVIGRLIAQKLTAALGQQVIVDNRAGAAGRLGTDYVAHATPDGYTLLMTTTTTIITAPALFEKLPYRSPQDFAPIGPIVTGAMILVVHPSVPARSVKALIALAKQHPGQLNFASTGSGDTNHLAGELFEIRSGVRMVHVPYKGAAPATLSVVMGETGLMFSNIVPVMPPLQAGKVVPLGITSLVRSPMVPDVRPVAEQGLPGFEVENLYMLLAPHGTPAGTVRRLSDELRKAVQAPELKERLQADGSRVIAGTPDELEKTIVTEIAKWTQVIKTAGIKAEP